MSKRMHDARLTPLEQIFTPSDRIQFHKIDYSALELRIAAQLGINSKPDQDLHEQIKSLYGGTKK